MDELLGDLFPYAIDEKDEADKVETLEQLRNFVATALADPLTSRPKKQEARSNGPLGSAF